MDTQEQQYIKGFNNAYLLAEHEPSLLKSISKTLTPQNEYLDGFISGKLQHELDQTRSQLEELQHLRDTSKDQDLELE